MWLGQLFSSRYPQRDNFPTVLSDTLLDVMITWLGQLFSSCYPQRDNFPTTSPTHYQMLWSSDLISCSPLTIYRGSFSVSPLRHHSSILITLWRGQLFLRKFAEIFATLPVSTTPVISCSPVSAGTHCRCHWHQWSTFTDKYLRDVS